MSYRRKLITVLAVGMAASANAQLPQSSDSKAHKPTADIVVQGLSDAQLRDMVGSLTTSSRDTQLARWNGGICPRVLGLEKDYADLIEQRIAAVARDLGVSVLKKPCRPTIYIVATPDGDALARSFIKLEPALMRDPTYGPQHGAELKALTTPRPVRWVDATRTGGADGIPLIGSTSIGYGGGSRLSRPVRENKVFSFVIVDTRKVDHVTWGQLADYLAMVTLAHPALTAQSAGSIMSIFAARDAGIKGPSGLTQEDLGVLRGLYLSNASLDAATERAQIVDRMKSGHARLP